MNEPQPLAFEYPSNNRRFMAAAIDIIIILLIAMPIAGFAAKGMFESTVGVQLIMELGRYKDATQAHEIWNAAKDFLFSSQIIAQMLIENLIQLLIVAVYILPCWSRYSATPGKMLAGMIIVDEAKGLPMTKKQLFLRFFGYIVATLPLALGFVPMLVTKRKQGVQDMIAHTVVIMKPRKQKAESVMSATEPSQ